MQIQKKLRGIPLTETCIEDPTDAGKVRQAFSAIPEKAHLHYTGGTKIMAAHARMALALKGGRDEHASYLDERRGVLRFDDGYETELAREQLTFTVEDTLALHGIQILSEEDPVQTASSAEDA